MKRGLPEQRKVPGVTSIVAVASGKGGVGKSTVAVNLALALASVVRPGHRALSVGLMDADVYGPSIPTMMQLTGLRAETDQDGSLLPLTNFGMPCMSMGFLIEEKGAAIWRGPMVGSAIQQMLYGVAWGNLDILVVDLPPGTGDAQLSLVQNVPLAGAVIVSTPQAVALADVRRAVAMFNKVNVPILGVVENMSTFTCPKCAHVSPVFGKGGALAEAEEMGVPALGALPIDIRVRELSDAGKPIVVMEPENPTSKTMVAIAEKLIASLFEPRKDI